MPKTKKEGKIVPLQPMPKIALPVISLPMTQEMVKKKYNDVYKMYKLVCNNTVNGGDCYGESYCDENCNHKDIMCRECNILLCGCCLELQNGGKCPCCKKSVK